MENTSDQQSIDQQPPSLDSLPRQFSVRDPAIWTKMIYLIIAAIGIASGIIVRTDGELRIIFILGVLIACVISMSFWWAVLKGYDQALAFAKSLNSTSRELIDKGAPIDSVLQSTEMQRSKELERFTERVVLRSNTLIMLGMIGTALTIILGLPGVISSPPSSEREVQPSVMEAPLGVTVADQAKGPSEELSNAQGSDKVALSSVSDDPFERVLHLAPKAFAFTALALIFAIIISFSGNSLRDVIRDQFLDPAEAWEAFHNRSAAVDQNNQRLAETLGAVMDEKILGSLREMTSELQQLPINLADSVKKMQKASDSLANSAEKVERSFSEIATLTKTYLGEASNFSKSLELNNEKTTEVTRNLSSLQVRVEKQLHQTVKHTAGLQKENLDILKDELRQYRETFGKVQESNLSTIERELEKYRDLFSQEIPRVAQDVVNKLYASMSAPLEKVAAVAAQKLSDLGEGTISSVTTQWKNHLQSTKSKLDDIEDRVSKITEALLILGGTLDGAAQNWKPLTENSAEALKMLTPGLEQMKTGANSANQALEPLLLSLEKMVSLTNNGDGKGLSAFKRLEIMIQDAKDTVDSLKECLNEIVENENVLDSISSVLGTTQRN